MTTRKTTTILLTLAVSVALATTAFAASSSDPAAHGAAATHEPVRIERSVESSTTSTAADIPPAEEGEQAPTASVEQSAVGTDGTAPQPGSAHDNGPSAPDAPDSTLPIGPIGFFGDDGPIPAAFGTQTPSPQHGGSTGVDGPGSLAAAPSCSHQCITKGVAYAQGSDVELVIETSVPAQLYISVVADLDQDGSYESDWVETTVHGYTSYSWLLEDLEPGHTYYAMVAATDDNFYTSYAWGEFTL